MTNKIIVLNESVDKNGTVIKEVEENCNRCGGGGQSDKWVMTGKTCFKCGGTGRQRAKYKEYTPEYRAKLDAQNEKRNKNKEQSILDRNLKRTKEIMESLGIQTNTLHIVRGNTYAIKDTLKSDNAKFNDFLKWFFNADNENYKKYETTEVNLNDVITINDFGGFEWDRNKLKELGIG